MLEADDAVSHPGEFGGTVVHLLFAHLAGGGVDGEPPQFRRRKVHGRFAPHVAEAGQVEHDGVAVLVGIHGVEDVAGVDVVPSHLIVGAVARHHAQPGRVVVVPADGHFAAHRQFHVEHRRQVHEHHVVPGDVEVMHHGRPADRDVLHLHQLAIRRYAQVAQVGRHGRVAEGEQFAGDRADLGVRGE